MVKASFRKYLRIRKDASGSAMLEYAVGLALLILILVLIADISAMMMIKGVLNTAAIQGIHTARLVPNLDIVTDGLEPGDYDRRRYLDSIHKVEESTRRLLSGSLIAPLNVEGRIRLVGFEHFDTDGTKGVAVLRPYECAKVGGSPEGCKSGDDDCVRHSALSDDEDCAEGLVSDSVRAYEEESIIVVLRVEMDPWVPFLGSVTIEGKALGFRQPVPRSDPALSQYGFDGPLASSTTSKTKTTWPE